MDDIIKIIQALQDSDISLKRFTKTIKNKPKKQKGRFLSMLLGTLGAILLGNLLTGKIILRAGSGHPSYENKKGKGILKDVSGHSSSSALQNKKEWDF